MIIRSDHYVFLSQNANVHYFEEGIYPSWAALNLLRGFQGVCLPLGRPGEGVEPHYHDCDEIWLFTAGRGEVWLDGKSHAVTPNTLVYTAMGTVHRFQMFTPYENNAMVTRLERQKRPVHILVEEYGPPVPTVPSFVVPGEVNNGPIPDRGTRCPLSELRMLTFRAGEGIAEARLSQNEYWMTLGGRLLITVSGITVELAPGDVGLLRLGATRRVSSAVDSRAIVARE